MPGFLALSIPLFAINEYGHYQNMDLVSPVQMRLVETYQANYRNMFNTLKKTTTIQDICESLFGVRSESHSESEISLHEQAVKELLYHSVFEGYN